MGVYIGAKIRGKFNSFGEIFVELVSSLFPCRAWTFGWRLEINRGLHQSEKKKTKKAKANA